MSEGADKESKTLEATEKRVQDALEKGNVPVSREMAGFASLLAILSIVVIIPAAGFGRFVAVMATTFELAPDTPIDNGADAVAALHAVLFEAARLLAFPVAILALAGLLASVAQNQPRLVWSRIAPDLKRISIASGLGRLTGVRGGVEAMRSMLKVAAVGIAALIVLKGAWMGFVVFVHRDAAALLEALQANSVSMVSAILGMSLSFLAFDVLWSRFSWRRDLRMSHQEVKDEHKQADGDPHVKARRRQLARQRVRKSMVAAVPKATLVVVNPTHYAVAMRYIREETAAPVVVAKGIDLIALKIRSVAEENGIPVIEDRLLARSLYQSVEVDRLIPPEFYKAVAGLIYYIHSKTPKAPEASKAVAVPAAPVVVHKAQTSGRS